MKHLSKLLKKGNDYLTSELKKREDKMATDHNSLFNSKGEIQGEYPPFAASFGATVIRSGLMPAIFLYAEKSGSGKSKIPLTQLFLELLKEPGDTETTLKDYVLNRHEVQGNHLKKRLINVSIASKLCLRTFPVADKNKPS